MRSHFGCSSKLQLLVSLLFVYINLAAAASTINAYTDNKCTKQPRRPQVGSPDGFCQQVSTPNATSVDIDHLDERCTVTVYSDIYCSFDAVEVYIGDCGVIPKGKKIRSFSVDGCRVTTTSKPASKTSTTMSTVRSSTAVLTSSTPSASPTAAEPAPQSTTNRGAVIGGATAGSIAGVALIIAAIFLIRRRRKKESEIPSQFAQQPPAGNRYTGPQELDAKVSSAGEWKWKQNNERMADENAVHEMAATGFMADQIAKPRTQPLQQVQELEGTIPESPMRVNEKRSNEALPEVPKIPGP